MSQFAEFPTANWNFPTSIRFGVGRIAELPEICASLGMLRPLLVTDRGLAELQLVHDVLAANENAGIPTGIYSGVQPNPTGENVNRGLEMYRSGGYDGVIAFGGGSPLDVGKSIAFMLPQTRPIWDFEDIGDNHKLATARGIPPIVAIPTTAGTGSEVGRGTVITDEASRTKKIIFHPAMLPRVAILDPALTVGVPPAMTAGAGFDALSHNLEAICATGYHPLADGIAVEGTRLVHEHLLSAFQDGRNLEARSGMLAAAAMGATAFQKGLGAVHALSHPVGALFDTHHGLTNAVFLPYVLQHNKPAIEHRMKRVAAYLGLENPGFDALQRWILDLRAQTGIPHTLVDLNVDPASLERMAEMAAVDPPIYSNPIPLSARDLLGIYQRAMSGDI